MKSMPKSKIQNNQTPEKLGSIFAPAYWEASASEFKSIKQITAASLLVALGIIIGMFDIRLIPNILQVSFSYIAFSLCSFITGPLMAIPCGMIADLVDALWHGYDLFFGYTLSAVAQSFIFAIFLYRRDITLPRVVAAKTCVNLFVNILLSSVWRVMMMGGEYFYYVFIAALKNLIMLPVEVVIMMIFLRALTPALRRLKMVPRQTVFKIDRSDIILTCLLFILGVILSILYFGNYNEINSFIRGLL